MSDGFQLRELTLSGPGVPVARVSFAEGLNVISGPSDTGKTFIAQCIDFMLGATRPPKEIPEAAPYDNVLLRILANGTEQEYTLQRSLRGGDFRLSSPGGRDVVLGAKHQGDNPDTVSAFLLQLCGLAGKKVRTNQRGRTRPLSFRDLARLVLVDEETVIGQLSPLQTGQVVTRTAEISVFRLLLSGVDDSAVVAKEDPKLERLRLEGRSDLIDTLLTRTREQIAGLQLGIEEDEIRSRLAAAESHFSTATAELATEQETLSVITSQRNAVWTRLRQTDSRINVLTQLQRRFELLQQQYASDLRRLEAIAEAGIRLSQMREERCPICGALAEHHDSEHRKPHLAPEGVAGASRAEAEKIQSLIVDLTSTQQGNASEIQALEERKRIDEIALADADHELAQRLRPRLEAALQKLRASQSERDGYQRAVSLFERVTELNQLASDGDGEGGSSSRAATGQSAPIAADEAEQFSKEVEAVLRSWHFPNLTRVTFSDLDQDIIISGRRRASHGKGVRAITHAAFIVALLRYCVGRSMPHPGFVVIDSPLVVYREPDPDENGFTRDVKDAFYRSLATNSAGTQAIILENEDPPGDLESSANIVRFTGTTVGRRGFLPASPSAPLVARS